MEFSGQIIALCPSDQRRTGQGKNGQYAIDWFVVEELTGQYPKKVCFEVFSNTERPRWKTWNLQKGATVTVSYDIDAREWNGKWFNTLNAYKVVDAYAGGGQMAAAQPVPPFQTENGAPQMVPGTNPSQGLQMTVQQVEEMRQRAKQQMQQNAAFQNAGGQTEAGTGLPF